MVGLAEMAEVIVVGVEMVAGSMVTTPTLVRETVLGVSTLVKVSEVMAVEPLSITRFTTAA